MYKELLASLALAVSASALPAFATPIAPGQEVTATDLGNIAPYLTQVAVINGATISPGTYTATYDVGVFKDSSNPLGGLDFTFHVTNNGPGTFTRVTGFDFDSLTLDVGYLSAAGMRAPLTIDRSSSGGTVGFNFLANDTILPGDTTDILVVRTNANSYTNGLFTTQGGSAGTGPSYQPLETTAVTPEPSSLVLLGTGLLGAFGAARRKLSL